MYDNIKKETCFYSRFWRCFTYRKPFISYLSHSRLDLAGYAIYNRAKIKERDGVDIFYLICRWNTESLPVKIILISISDNYIVVPWPLAIKSCCMRSGRGSRIVYFFFSRKNFVSTFSGMPLSGTRKKNKKVFGSLVCASRLIIGRNRPLTLIKRDNCAKISVTFFSYWRTVLSTIEH